MFNKAILVLLFFCSLVIGQSACAAGLLLHCHHPEEDLHQQDSCPEDLCDDDYSLPLTTDVKTQTDSCYNILLCSEQSATWEPTEIELPEVNHLTANLCCPSGSFPLLI